MLVNHHKIRKISGFELYIFWLTTRRWIFLLFLLPRERDHWGLWGPWRVRCRIPRPCISATSEHIQSWTPDDKLWKPETVTCMKETTFQFGVQFLLLLEFSSSLGFKATSSQDGENKQDAKRAGEWAWPFHMWNLSLLGSERKLWNRGKSIAKKEHGC